MHRGTPTLVYALLVEAARVTLKTCIMRASAKINKLSEATHHDKKLYRLKRRKRPASAHEAIILMVTAAAASRINHSLGKRRRGSRCAARRRHRVKLTSRAKGAKAFEWR